MNRERIAALMWHTEAVGSGTPESVALARTFEGFHDCSDDVRDPWLKQAYAIIAAMPSMIAPLVWVGTANDCFMSCNVGGAYYELVVSDTLERSCDYVWSASYCQRGLPDECIETPPQASSGQAMTAANNHHRAAIMAAFKEPTT